MAEGEIDGNDTKVLAAGRVLDLLSMARIECLETAPGNAGATMEKTSAVDLGLEGKVLASPNLS